MQANWSAWKSDVKIGILSIRYCTIRSNSVLPKSAKSCHSSSSRIPSSKPRSTDRCVIALYATCRRTKSQVTVLIWTGRWRITQHGGNRGDVSKVSVLSCCLSYGDCMAKTGWCCLFEQTGQAELRFFSDKICCLLIWRSSISQLIAFFLTLTFNTLKHTIADKNQQKT